MKLENMGETIAARNLSLISDGGPDSEVLALLGEPSKLRATMTSTGRIRLA